MTKAQAKEIIGRYESLDKVEADELLELLQVMTECKKNMHAISERMERRIHVANMITEALLQNATGELADITMVENLEFLHDDGIFVRSLEIGEAIRECEKTSTHLKSLMHRCLQLERNRKEARKLEYSEIMAEVEK